VLVVDDAEPIRRLVARALASEGFVVDEAADGHQAATRPASGSTPSPPTSWSSKRS
jgi:DNA-binding response OmpR family regulator